MYGEPNTNKMQRTARNAIQQFHRIHGKAKGSMMKRIWKRVISSSPVIKGVFGPQGQIQKFNKIRRQQKELIATKTH